MKWLLKLHQKVILSFLTAHMQPLNNSTFTSYTKDGFTLDDHKRLAKVFKELDKKGCYLMLTNHNTELIRDLYRDYYITVIKAKRLINSNASKRVGGRSYNYKLYKGS
ncbi:Pseudogene of Adenine specific DNAmethyltransferase (C terminal part) [Mycoplasmopsis agalactiae PG2]|nr:Pseudogene of Adenine specific DNAmethyltransferase (C terminal part) [Mycoplasmopsis agalactiae PG2]